MCSNIGTFFSYVFDVSFYAVKIDLNVCACVCVFMFTFTMIVQKRNNNINSIDSSCHHESSLSMYNPVNNRLMIDVNHMMNPQQKEYFFSYQLKMFLFLFGENVQTVKT